MYDQILHILREVPWVSNSRIIELKVYGRGQFRVKIRGDIREGLALQMAGESRFSGGTTHHTILSWERTFLTIFMIRMARYHPPGWQASPYKMCGRF